MEFRTRVKWKVWTRWINVYIRKTPKVLPGSLITASWRQQCETWIRYVIRSSWYLRQDGFLLLLRVRTNTQLKPERPHCFFVYSFYLGWFYNKLEGFLLNYFYSPVKELHRTNTLLNIIEFLRRSVLPRQPFTMIQLVYCVKHSLWYAMVVYTISLTYGASVGAEQVPSNALASWNAQREITKLNRRYRRDTRQPLRCPPCEQIHCSPKRASKLNCRGGVTLGVCNCCPRCAKLEGEPCRGKWDYLGLCDTGLECVSVSQFADIPGQDQSITLTEERNGICRRGMYNLSF